MTVEGPGGRVRFLGIRLMPTGVCALLRTPLHALIDDGVDLHDVIGKAAAKLAVPS